MRFLVVACVVAELASCAVIPAYRLKALESKRAVSDGSSGTSREPSAGELDKLKGAFADKYWAHEESLRIYGPPTAAGLSPPPPPPASPPQAAAVAALAPPSELQLELPPFVPELALPAVQAPFAAPLPPLPAAEPAVFLPLLPTAIDAAADTDVVTPPASVKKAAKRRSKSRKSQRPQQQLQQQQQPVMLNFPPAPLAMPLAPEIPKASVHYGFLEGVEMDDQKQFFRH